MIRKSALLLALSALGCGPVRATGVVGDADAALSRARAAEGDKYAAYETTLAELYLAKAREAQGHARYAEAEQLAAEALRYARAAAKNAGERRMSGTPPPVPSVTVEHPPAPEKKP